MLENIAFLDDHLSIRDIHERTSKASELATFAGLKDIHQVTRLCNAAKFDAVTLHKPVEDRTVKGDPTDTALLRFSEALSVPSLGIDTAQLLQIWTKHFEIPFNSRNKWALTVAVPNDEKHKNSGWMLVKGGPDVLFSSCSSVLQCDGSSVPFGPNERQRMSAIRNEWSSEGKRVLALWVSRSQDNTFLNTCLQLPQIFGRKQARITCKHDGRIDVLRNARFNTRQPCRSSRSSS